MIVQVVVEATFVAAESQFVPAHESTPAEMAGTVQSLGVQTPVAAKDPAVQRPGDVQV